MKRLTLYILLLFSPAAWGWSWWPLPMAEPDNGRDTLAWSAALSATAGYGTYSPFFMQSMRQGCVSSAPFSGSVRVAVEKPATRPARWFDYDMAADITGIVHSTPQAFDLMPKTGSFPVLYSRHADFIVQRLYAHVRLYIVDIAAGVMPLTDDMDTPLGSGSLLFSANAPSMPALRIGFDRWTPVPGLFGYLELKGALVHAWLTDNAYTRGSMIHYKYAGLQVGGRLPVNISYEFHHAAQWGGYSPAGTDQGNDLPSFWRVMFAQSGGSTYNEKFNALGNHLGSQQLALTLKGKGWNCKIYWQNFLEDNFAFLGKGHNLPDGRWGLTASQTYWPYLNRLTLEYVCTADQSGPIHDQDGIIYAGNDSYYQNSVFRQGWNYYLRSLGTPLITAPLYNTDGTTQTLNSRVKAWHLGLGGDIRGFRYSFMACHVLNYGNYTGNPDWQALQSRNTALLLDVQKTVPKAWGLTFGLRLAADFGTQWGTQAGAMLTICKQGLITTY